MEIKFEVMKKNGKEIYRTDSYKDIYGSPLFFSVKNKEGKYLGMEGLGGKNVIYERELIDIKKEVADRENLKMHGGFLVFTSDNIGELLEEMLDVSVEIVKLWRKAAHHKVVLWRKVRKSIANGEFYYIKREEAKDIEKFFFPDGAVVFYPVITFSNIEVCYIVGLFDAILSGLHRRYRSISFDYLREKAVAGSLISASLAYFYYRELKPCFAIVKDSGLQDKFIELLDSGLLEILSQPFSERTFRKVNQFIACSLV